MPMLSRRRWLSQSPVSEFRSLHWLAAEAETSRRAAGMPLAPPNASPQLRAEWFAALLSGPISPWLEFQLGELERYLAPIVSEVSYAITRGRLLSFDNDLTKECVVISLRSASRWYQAWLHRGCPADVEWVAFLIGRRGRALRTLIRRRVRCGRLRLNCDLGRGDRPVDFSEVGFDPRDSNAAFPCGQHVWQAVGRLTALEQRCLRLSILGTPPTHRAWRVAKIAQVLGREEVAVTEAIQSAQKSMALWLNSPPEPIGRPTPSFNFAG